MFTGIIESLGAVKKIETEGTNVHLTIESPISHELKIDQSLAHNGICLTVTALGDKWHTVTAVEETVKKTSLGDWRVGEIVNLERAMLAHARLDGHIVQGHVDNTALCIGREDQNGSWLFAFRYNRTPEYFVVNKGSICINGVSLTVVDPKDDTFSVAIIPYTFDHTNFSKLQVGERINLEFDIIGKYITRYFEAYKEMFIQNKSH